MKQKIICFLLCISMLAGGILMTGCSSNTNGSVESTDEEGPNVSSSMTLTLWVPTSADTTEEAIALVEEAINDVTQMKYDTAIKLYAIPEDEYDEAIRKQVETIAIRTEEKEKEELEQRKEQIAAAKDGVTSATTAATTGAADTESEYSLIVQSAPGYPHVESTQMDIFLIHGTEEYEYYADNLYLSPLDDELSSASKSLKEYIYPDFFTAAQYEGATYGVPNNHAVGEYTYLLMNKRLVDAEYLDPNTFTSLDKCKGFIEDVAKYYTDVTPVYGVYEPTYYNFWSSQDQSTFSVLASRLTEDISYDIETTSLFRNIFKVSNYTSGIYLYKTLQEKGYVSTNANVGEFGVGIIKGTAADMAAYENDYYINVLQNPQGTRDDYLQSVFAVSSYTKSVSRSMQIITLLNTDTELRTILQYGAEGTHWKYDEEDSGIIVKLSDDYKMNMLDTGNAFVTYPDYNTSMDAWEISKQQNLDSYCPITMNFVYQNEDNKALLAELDKLNKEIKADIDSMSAEEFNNSISSLQQKVESSNAFQKLTYIPDESTDSLKGKTPENGWVANASICNLWNEVVEAIVAKQG